MVLEKTLESPLDYKEIQQFILKEINPDYSLDGLMLKLKLQYFGHLMQRADSFEKTLMLGKVEGRRRGVLGSFFGEGNGNPLQYSCLENLMDGGAWWAAVYGVAQSQTQLK